MQKRRSHFSPCNHLLIKAIDYVRQLVNLSPSLYQFIRSECRVQIKVETGQLMKVMSATENKLISSHRDTES